MPENTVKISVELPNPMVQAIDRFVERGDFVTRTEVIRAAVRKFMELHGVVGQEA